MAVLNPTSILSQGGGLGVGQRAIGLAGMLQQQRANEQKIKANEAAMQQQQLRQQQMPQLMQQAQELYKSGDIDAIAEFSIANPQLGEQILKMRGLSQGEGKQRVSDRFSRIYTSQNPRADLAQEIEAGTAQGLDMSDSIRLLESNATDDEIRQQAGIALASVDPSRQQSISRAMGAGMQQQKPTAGIAEYEYVKGLSPEEKAEFFKVKRGEKPSPEQQMRLEQEKSDLAVKTEQTKAERKAGVQALSGIAKSQKSARQNLGTINRLKSLNKKAFSGLAANERLAIAKAAKSFGIPVEGVSESEQLKALSNELVLNKSQQMSGALSNADMQFLLDTAPTLSQSAEGRGKMLEYADALAKREIEYAKAAQKFRKENGYFDQLQFEQEFDAENKPLFEDEVIEQSATTVTTPVGQEFTSSSGIKYKVIE